MNLTWRDGVTTVAAAGAIAVERAYFHDYAWPLVSSTRWTVGIIATLLAVSVISSYGLDKVKSTRWTFVTSFLGIIGVLFATVGFITGNADYAVMLMLTTIAFGLSALVRHVTVRPPMSASHA